MAHTKLVKALPITQDLRAESCSQSAGGRMEGVPALPLPEGSNTWDESDIVEVRLLHIDY